MNLKYLIIEVKYKNSIQKKIILTNKLRVSKKNYFYYDQSVVPSISKSYFSKFFSEFNSFLEHEKKISSKPKNSIFLRPY